MKRDSIVQNRERETVSEELRENNSRIRFIVKKEEETDKILICVFSYIQGDIALIKRICLK